MKRQPFYILLLKGIGYIVLGNALCFFMTMALTMFTSKSDNPGFVILMDIIAILCSLAIFHMLMFTVAWKDGARERSLVKNHRVDAPLPHRWLILGIIMFLIAALPTIVLLLNKLFFPQADTFYIYRFVSGSAYPFIQTFVPMPELETKAWVHRLPADRRYVAAVPGAYAHLLRDHSRDDAAGVVCGLQRQIQQGRYHVQMTLTGGNFSGKSPPVVILLLTNSAFYIIIE